MNGNDPAFRRKIIQLRRAFLRKDSQRKDILTEYYHLDVDFLLFLRKIDLLREEPNDTFCVSMEWISNRTARLGKLTDLVVQKNREKNFIDYPLYTSPIDSTCLK